VGKCLGIWSRKSDHNCSSLKVGKKESAGVLSLQWKKASGRSDTELRRGLPGERGVAVIKGSGERLPEGDVWG